MTVTKHLLVKGHVQGVGYRMSMLYAANRFGLVGWVRNTRNGDVEAVVQGEESDVEEFIDWAHQGPGLARVDNVDVSDDNGQFSQFEIKDTV